MRRILLLGLAGLALVPAAAAGGSARLSVTDRSPFTVHGLGFSAGERVRVVVTAASGGTTRWVTSGSRGGLIVHFPGVKLGRCPAYVVRAYGARGSRASLRFMPECPQPFDP
jgi:hypothetical protein